MTTNSEAGTAARERLSALVDGELEQAAVTQACAHWRESTEARSTWHAYQLIGDALRSDDLASDPRRDANFIAALRARLATEPVVLAPQPFAIPAMQPEPARAAVGGTGRRWSWLAPTAVAAGFVAVVGVLTLTRTSGLLPDRPAASSLALAAPAVEPQTFVASGQVIRDAQLDRYLAAHKQFVGSSALGVPSGLLRNATAEVVGR